MTVIVAGLVVVVVLLSLLVAGLLRSHATILRQLHQLGADGADRTGPDPGMPTVPGGRPRTDGSLPAPQADVPDGRRAVDVVGTGPRGESMAVRTRDVAHDTVLVFLSTGCTTCASFWTDLATPGLPDGMRLVIVTRDASDELPDRVREVAPADATVVMSSQTWEGLGVPGSPFVVHVHGPSGRVVGEGTAASWEQVLELFLRADGERGSTPGKAGADARRERTLDRVLLEAGIAPGDPSLYGDRDGAPAERPDERAS